ncbi:MAG: P-II family nitrogen regulator [Clostridia bacterium]|nr:P-II family nitrogen regulator [Clostridia bacterium]
MQGVYAIITVANRHHGELLLRFFRETGASAVLSLPGEGTATNDVLDLLGLEATEKTVFFAFAPGEVKRRIMRDLVYKLMIDAPGAGVAMSVPVDSVGGGAALKLLLGENNLQESEEKPMNDTPYALITVIANRGCTDMVMDAARSVGATGGTVLHVKGAGGAHAEKFFGMSIADEKEMILIAAEKASCPGIMKAVMAQAGLNTRAHAICFSMPIDQIAGFRLGSD